MIVGDEWGWTCDADAEVDKPAAGTDADTDGMLKEGGTPPDWYALGSGGTGGIIFAVGSSEPSPPELVSAAARSRAAAAASPEYTLETSLPALLRRSLLE